MATVLRIDSSIRSSLSTSRQLTSEFITAWKAQRPRDRIIERDLTINPMPHVSEEMMSAVYVPPELRSEVQERQAALADELILELLAADVLVIGAPMYNLSVSSSLKAWIDHVARAGVTFKYTPKGPVGLLSNKKAYVFSSRGGIYSRGPAKGLDYHESYLRSVLGFIGITDVSFVHAEGLSMGAEIADQALFDSRSAIAALMAA